MFSALIIEDDITVRSIINRILQKKFSLVVHTAVNGIDGLKILQENEIDIIFLDITMPFMSGIEFLKTIRKESKYKNTPVFVVSSHKEKEMVEEIIELGIYDYILKPIDAELTIQRVHRALDKIQRGH
jgi:CheY-like chemotaxis protein